MSEIPFEATRVISADTVEVRVTRTKTAQCFIHPKRTRCLCSEEGGEGPNAGYIAQGPAFDSFAVEQTWRTRHSEPDSGPGFWTEVPDTLICKHIVGRAHRYGSRFRFYAG